MSDGFVLGRVRLNFTIDGKTDVRDDLSAVTLDSDGNLWTASDELTGVHRLRSTNRGVFSKAKDFDLSKALDLGSDDGEVDEIDIEGLDFADSVLWITGSHTSTRGKPKGKKQRKDIARLAEVTRRPNRYVLARAPLKNGKPKGKIARLPFTPNGNTLTEALCHDDPHLGPFLHIPRPDEASLQLASKENGFDIEGIAVRKDRVFLGLRGPVLRGLAAVILEIEPTSDGDKTLSLKPIGDDDRPYRKHFVELEGMGIRDLCWDGEDLLILAGPSMDLSGLQTVWRLRKAGKLDDDSLTLGADKALQRVFDLPMVRGADKAEGIALFDGLDEQGLMVVYDSPSEARKRDGGIALADVFALPKG